MAKGARALDVVVRAVHGRKTAGAYVVILW